MHRWCGAIPQDVGNLPVTTPPKKNCSSSLPPFLFTYIYSYFSLNLNRITFYNIYLIIVVLSAFTFTYVCGVCMCVALPVCVLLLLNAEFTDLDSQFSKLALKIPSLPSVWGNRVEKVSSPAFTLVIEVQISVLLLVWPFLPTQPSPQPVCFRLSCTVAEPLIHRSSDCHFTFTCKVFKTAMPKFHVTFFWFFLI